MQVALDPAAGPPFAEPLFRRDNYAEEYGPPGAYWPERAERQGVSGKAVIQCALAASGALTSCTLLAEDPPTYGFGEGLLRAAQAGYMKARPKPGLENGAQVRIVVEYRNRHKHG